MKHLLLLRHGEANTSSTTQDDRDRVLTPAGIAASKRIGTHIAAHGPVPDLAMCSAAVRARMTWDAVRENINAEVDTDFRDDLYLADPDRVISIAAAVRPTCTTLIVIGHNPGFAQLVGQLTMDASSDALAALGSGFSPACLAVFNFDIENWREFPGARGRLETFVRP